MILNTPADLNLQALGQVETPPVENRPLRWQEASACRGKTSVMFGAEAAARSLCARCPVREVCLWSTLCREEQGGRFGVAGGASPIERDRVAESMPAHALAAARDRSLGEWRGSSACAPLRAAATLPVAATVRQCGDESRSGVVAIAAALLGVPEPAMTGPGRGRKEVAEARQALMFALHEGLNLSYSDIGRRLHRDHATVMHGVARSAARAAASPVIRQQLDALVVEVCAVGERLRVGSLCDIEPSIAVGAVEPEVRAARRRRRDASDENSVLAQAALRLVADDYGLLVADLSGPSRGPVVVEARQAAMYVLHRAAAFSYPGIGRALGGRDQTTARHGVARAGDRARRSEGARRRLERLCNQVQLAGSSAGAAA